MAQAICPAQPPGRSKSHIVRNLTTNAEFAFWVLGQLCSTRGWLALLSICVAGYAMGHGALAVGAGLFGRALVRVGPCAGNSSHDSGSLASTVLLGLLGSIVKSGSGTILSYAEVMAAGYIGRSLRQRILSGLLESSQYDAHSRMPARIAVRIREVESATTAGVLAGIRASFQLVPLAIALIALSPLLALGTLLVSVPFSRALGRARQWVRWASERVQQKAEELHGEVDELITNLDLFRTYGAGRDLVDLVDRTAHEATRSLGRVEAGRTALSSLNEVVGAMALLGAFLLAQVFGISLGDGNLVAFATIFFLTYRPIRDLGDARVWSIRGSTALTALGASLATERPRAPEGPRDMTVRPHRHLLDTLELVEFGAQGRGPTLSLLLGPGELLGLTGPTGSGKTTLLRALLGLLPARGTLRYAGRDITHAPVGPEIRPFAWVPQEAPLVSGTVAENVALVGASPSQAEVALAEIGAGALIDRVGDEQVGPGGRALSGGERRQVSLARALASGQPILLLDEPTVGLDEQATSCVLAALSALRGQRSAIVVTHDPRVAAVCDRVLDLEDLGSTRVQAPVIPGQRGEARRFLH